MSPDKICKLVVALPPEEPYFRLAFRNKTGGWPRSLPERLQTALGDPALAGNFAQSYARAELPLPQFDWDDAVHRLYNHSLHPERSDKYLQETVATKWTDELTMLSQNPRAVAVIKGILHERALEHLRAQREELERQSASTGKSGGDSSLDSNPCPSSVPAP